MRGLGKWADSVQAGKSSRLKAREKKSTGKSSLSEKSDVSHSGESAAIHTVPTDVLSFGDETGMGDNDPAVERTVERLSVAGSDVPATRQEKEARTVGGIPSR